MAAAPALAVQTPRSASRPSLWVVAALLIAHQAALTIIHYLVGPALGLDPASASLTAATIALGAVAILSLVAMDIRKVGRARAVLMVKPDWDRSTLVTMLGGLAVAQIPLGILALQGATVWQSGASSNLEVGRALVQSLVARMTEDRSRRAIGRHGRHVTCEQHHRGIRIGVYARVAAIIQRLGHRLERYRDRAERSGVHRLLVAIRHIVEHRRRLQ